MLLIQNHCTEITLSFKNVKDEKMSLALSRSDDDCPASDDERCMMRNGVSHQQLVATATYSTL